jgi:hypothetical protein
MWFDGDGDGTNLHHAILGWIIRLLLDHALSLHRFRPVLLEYALVDPFLT